MINENEDEKEKEKEKEKSKYKVDYLGEKILNDLLCYKVANFLIREIKKLGKKGGISLFNYFRIIWSWENNYY